MTGTDNAAVDAFLKVFMGACREHLQEAGIRFQEATVTVDFELCDGGGLHIRIHPISPGILGVLRALAIAADIEDQDQASPQPDPRLN